VEEKLRVKAEVGARAAARNVEENIVAVVFCGAELAGCVLFGGRIDGCGVDVVVMRGGWGVLGRDAVWAKLGLDAKGRSHVRLCRSAARHLSLVCHWSSSAYWRNLTSL
jgi:hypothetical protein